LDAQQAADETSEPGGRSRSKTRVNAAAKYKFAGQRGLYGEILLHFSIIDTIK
jgi:hypothetical protein